MNLYRITFSCILLAVLPALAQDHPELSWGGNLYEHIHKYKEYHSDFFKKVCAGGADVQFYKLLRHYRSGGFYIPTLDDDIDRFAIKKGIPLIEKKLNYIEQVEARLKKLRPFPPFEAISENIQNTVKDLLKLKKEASLAVLKAEKHKIKKQSQFKMEILKKHFDLFIEQVFFLKSFNYPVDHLYNRTQYDAIKDKDGKNNKKKANAIFFHRKILEDGAYDSDHTYPDLYLRSTLDTIALSFAKENSYLSENLRHDLEWALKQIKKALKRGKSKQLERIKEWKDRTKKSLVFYSDIIQEKNNKKAKLIVADKNQATKELKEFVYSKQKESYQYWMKKPELYKALYVLETILFNEVGTVDGEGALERKDVVQIVLNRMQDPFYRSLDKDQILSELLLKEHKWNELEKEYWLNVLFRIGEFSFTYHYISSVVKIFCPDMSRRGRKIREQNLKLSLNGLKHRDKDFKALRYFSRVSMLGKIDMSSVWANYQRIPERAGLEVTHQDKLIRYYNADKYTFHYYFTDIKGHHFQVIEIDDVVYSMTWEKGRPKFYHYRSPQLFAYFEKLTP